MNPEHWQVCIFAVHVGVGGESFSETPLKAGKGSPRFLLGSRWRGRWFAHEPLLLACVDTGACLVDAEAPTGKSWLLGSSPSQCPKN